MSPELATLRRLRDRGRVEDGSSPDPESRAPGPSAADLMILRRNLLRRGGHAVPSASAAARSLPGKILAPGLHLVFRERPASPIDPQTLADLGAPPGTTPADLLFFDSETTGLAGGCGTRPFMLGAARLRQGRLELRQLLIARPGAEEAMLREFATWFATPVVLVSFNGKSYDLPLLRTRWRLFRLPDPCAGMTHLDLLHAARRRWRDELPDCRLQTIEREVLGIRRDDDLPGSEAPAAWRGYLRGGPATPLARVLAHNEQDLATLATLLGRLGG